MKKKIEVKSQTLFFIFQREESLRFSLFEWEGRRRLQMSRRLNYTMVYYIS